ncbi:zinc knuckle-domain-containing protein [Collybia nuda]|uniref:Zinc knuckle-domain-containing protein n=1 Tax=Collybia nuda TaxID=64659 RepID=A0A9P5Y7L5_9AGAR|nr:zinc knuckle-domain-containing protein [Collybia nuda]
MSKYAPHRRSTNQPRATSTTICQKCLGTGHFIYECKSTRPYVSRPSRTQQLENPRVLAKLKAEGKPSFEVPEEFKHKSGMANKILETKEKERQKGNNDEGTLRKRARRSSPSDSDSSEPGSNSDSDSGSDSSSASSSSSDSSRSRERGRKRRVPTKRDHSDSRSSSRSSDGSRSRRR